MAVPAIAEARTFIFAEEWMMLKHRPISAVGFDFGRTLVPAFRAHLDEEFDRTLQEELGTEMGCDVATEFRQRESAYYECGPEGGAFLAKVELVLSMQAAGLAGREDLAGGILDEVRDRFLVGVRPFDSVGPLVEHLKSSGLLVGILSNWVYPSDWLEQWVIRQGLSSAIDVSVSSADLPWRKPSRHIFSYLAQVLGVGLSEMAFVGNDFEEDILGACAAGLRSVVMVGQSGLPLSVRLPQGVRVVESVSEVWEEWT